MLNLLAADRIVGMMSAYHLRHLASWASSYSSILEVGSWRGRSTRALCDNCAPGGTVTAVDTWRGSPELLSDLDIMAEASGDPDYLYHEFQRNLSPCRNLEVCRMPSLDAAALYASQGRKFEMIFLDALHDYASISADIRAWYPLLSKPGLFCGHDLQYLDVHRAVAEAFPQFSHDPVPDAGLWAIHFLPLPAPSDVTQVEEVAR